MAFKPVVTISELVTRLATHIGQVAWLTISGLIWDGCMHRNARTAVCSCVWSPQLMSRWICIETKRPTSYVQCSLGRPVAHSSQPFTSCESQHETACTDASQHEMPVWTSHNLWLDHNYVQYIVYSLYSRPSRLRRYAVDGLPHNDAATQILLLFANFMNTKHYFNFNFIC